MSDPETSLFAEQKERVKSIGDLFALAAEHLPSVSTDQVVVSAQVDGRGVSVTGTVTVRNFDGIVIGAWKATGEKSVTGAIRWRF